MASSRGGVEVDDARDVDDRVDGALQLVHQRLVDAAERAAHVAVDRRTIFGSRRKAA